MIKEIDDILQELDAEISRLEELKEEGWIK